MRKINAAKFKATCLALLDEVAKTGETIVILKRGKPVARLMPPTSQDHAWPQTRLKGTGRIVGDILAPVLPPKTWDANRGKLV